MHRRRNLGETGEGGAHAAFGEVGVVLTAILSCLARLRMLMEIWRQIIERSVFVS